ncbi:lipoprotein insertase outer membrane protein LolB [Lysobacter sp. CA199]|uniref:lipoprotein insertase outer membrane protein LolB n=1 Tax=Lysobacter sp. CA199 TaxID=3455608 RepID=UPI003F8D335A
MSAAMQGTARYPRAAKLFAAASLIALLGACAGPGIKQVPAGSVVPAADAIEREAARTTRVRARGEWSLTGRIAVSNAGKGGSGRIEWSQRGERYDVALSAPVTRQSWRLSAAADGARLEGLEGGPREGADAGQLLLETTGWDIPVAALGDWLHGLPAQSLAEARIVPGPDGRPLSIEQDGWNIVYQWPASGDLPSRLDARRAKAQVRLIVDEWKGEATEAAPGKAEPSAAVLLPGPISHPLRQQLLALNLDNPAADMRANFARGERRPVGLGTGWGMIRAPAWGEVRWRSARTSTRFEQSDRQQVRMLDGTDTDYIDEPALWERAEAYAGAYNAALREYLRYLRYLPANGNDSAAISR